MILIYRKTLLIQISYMLYNMLNDPKCNKVIYICGIKIQYIHYHDYSTNWNHRYNPNDLVSKYTRLCSSEYGLIKFS